MRQLCTLSGVYLTDQVLSCLTNNDMTTGGVKRLKSSFVSKYAPQSAFLLVYHVVYGPTVGRVDWGCYGCQYRPPPTLKQEIYLMENGSTCGLIRAQFKGDIFKDLNGDVNWS